jgi:hypothetical protein
VSALDERIDELYALPLSEFTAARNALARTVKGDEAASIKRLAKPSAHAWVLNQLYWRNRKVFTRLVDSGARLRAAQLAALERKRSDLAAAASAHREALVSAVTAAASLARAGGVNATGDQLTRMLEALSMAPALPAAPGRLLDTVQPAGFEALAGLSPASLTPAAIPAARSTVRKPAASAVAADKASPDAADKKAASRERERLAAVAARRKAAEADLRQAERAVQRAEDAQTRASAEAERARAHASAAESALADARQLVDRSRALLREKQLALQSVC